MLLLRHFFWAPVAALIATRQGVARQIVDGAAAQKTAAATVDAEYARTRAGFAAERETILAAARTEADRNRATLLDQAHGQAAALEAAAHARIETDRQAAEKLWAAQARVLGIDIARRLAGRLEGAAVHAAFLDWLVKAIADLPQATRQSASHQTDPIDAVSATALTTAEQSLAATLIGKAFGEPVHLAFRVDPALIAGIELHASHLVVANSWQADLATIRADLADA